MNPRGLLKSTLFLSFYTLLTASAVRAHIHPAQDSRLTATQVMFEVDDVPGAQTYMLTIQPVNQQVVTGPDLHFKTTQPALLVRQGLRFGQQYQWLYKAYKKNQLIYTSPYYRFTILTSPQTDSNRFRQQVYAVGKTGSDLILLDKSGMAIDRKGNPVWFMPINTDSMEQQNIRDLQLTAGGTITYLDQNGAWEKNTEGQLLWKGPDDGRISGFGKETYHHQLTKLPDGSYMVCGFTYKPGTAGVTNDAPRFNTLIQYNADGSVRWHWNELTSLQNDPLFRRYQNNSGGGHLNGFAFTPDRHYLLMSFKNLSDVFVLNYKTGLFETSIKTNLPSPAANFSQQHGPSITPSGDVWLYNNNITDEDKENDRPSYPAALCFRYDAARKTFSLIRSIPVISPFFPKGIKGKEGYCSETVPDHVLVCAGGVNYSAEYNTQGKKIWEVLFYKKKSADTAWMPYTNYRSRRIPSLYPLYVTIRPGPNGKNHLVYQIYNAGSMEQRYQLIFKATDTNKNFRYDLPPLPAGAVKNITLPAAWQLYHNIEVTVVPLADTRQKKVYRFQFSE